MARPLRIEYEGVYYHVTAREDEWKSHHRTKSASTDGRSPGSFQDIGFPEGLVIDESCFSDFAL